MRWRLARPLTSFGWRTDVRRFVQADYSHHHRHNEGVAVNEIHSVYVAVALDPGDGGVAAPDRPTGQYVASGFRTVAGAAGDYVAVVCRAHQAVGSDPLAPHRRVRDAVALELETLFEIQQMLT